MMYRLGLELVVGDHLEEAEAGLMMYQLGLARMVRELSA